MKQQHLLVVTFLGFSLAAFAQNGTYTTYTTTWNNLPRQYGIYVPQSLAMNPAMVLFLHGTATPPAGPQLATPQWEAVANQNQFLMVWPISTFNARSGQWYWSAYNLDYSFIPAPDDVGFIRNVIGTVAAHYAVNPKAVYVTGMSSGALMTQRVGVEISDLVAAIAPVSGQIQMQQITNSFSPEAPTNFISVLEFHGDVDTDLEYCGSSPHSQWGETGMSLASVDDSVNYWVAANGLPPNLTPLCTNGVPSAGVNGYDAIGNGVEVNFVRELGVGHQWLPTTYEAVWNFFAAHPKS